MSDNNKCLELNKIDVAVRQLETAIKLYFIEEESVSIHTLTMASYNILRELNTETPSKWLMIKPNKNIDINNPPEGSIYYNIKPESRMWVYKKFNEATNFFKHADNDPNNVCKFYYQATELFMSQVERELTVEYKVNSFLLFAFRCWFMTYYPNLFIISDNDKEILSSLKVESKKEFSDNNFIILNELWEMIKKKQT